VRYLFVHQNFPGQFRHVAAALADNAHEVVAVGEKRNLQGRAPLHPRVLTLAHEPNAQAGKDTHHYLRDYETQIRRGQSVARLALKLRDEAGFSPDIVVAHPAWGEALFLRDIFPQARHVAYFEYCYQGAGGDIGFDPEFPATLDDRLRARIRNSAQLQALAACDRGISPTRWQRSTYPVAARDRIDVAHDGIDTRVARPDPRATVVVQGRTYGAADEIVTYVARHLEPYRGFHTFMRALPHLQALRPNATVLVVGGDGVSYGKHPPDGATYRQLYLAELGDRVDWSRVHFLGQLPYADYLKVLQVSSAHAYLTYPFVLSWSMLEAMSAGCLVVASSTPPVLEVIEAERNGLLVDFFDADALATMLAGALARPAAYRALREKARATVVERFDLHGVCLPQMLRLLDQV